MTANRRLTAIISCSDKEGMVPFARGLAELGWCIVSTGGTAALLEEAGIEVMPVAELTGHPELMEGRVKTLHPAVHSGILARRDHPEDLRALEEFDYKPIDMVVVNLYPFEETAAGEVPESTVLDNIDIGGPTMLRAAAKNFNAVIPLTRPADYDRVLTRLREEGEVDGDTRRQLAAEVFRHVSRYDSLVAVRLGGGSSSFLSFPEEMTVPLRRSMVLRYGENPHQQAALYTTPATSPLALSRLRRLSGPDLSFNNFLDIEVAVSTVAEFDRPTVCAIKHTNPCGVATHDRLSGAFRRAYDADPVSIFGGVVAVNRPVDMEFVQMIVKRKLFLDVLVAPEYSDEAAERLQRRQKLRVIQLEGLGNTGGSPGRLEMDRVDGRLVPGGMLVNTRDDDIHLRSTWKAAGAHHPDERQWADMEFAWVVAKHVTSNAIVVAGDGMTLGVGAGQMNRVTSARLALDAAGDAAEGAVLASDGMIPFPDVVELAAERNIAGIVQPGGSIRDEEIIEVADRAGMSMVTTGRRHFRH